MPLLWLSNLALLIFFFWLFYITSLFEHTLIWG